MIQRNQTFCFSNNANLVVPEPIVTAVSQPTRFSIVLISLAVVLSGLAVVSENNGWKAWLIVKLDQIYYSVRGQVQRLLGNEAEGAAQAVCKPITQDQSIRTTDPAYHLPFKKATLQTRVQPTTKAPGSPGCRIQQRFP